MADQRDEGLNPEGLLRWLVNRRRLLKLAGVSGGAVALPSPLRSLFLPGIDGLVDSLLGGEKTAEATAASLVSRLLRPDDQVRLTFEFVNLQRSGDQLTAIDGNAASLVRVLFGSQHTTEPAGAEGQPVPAGAIRHLAARPSRVVFRVTPPLSFTRDSLLDFASRELALDGRADPGLGGASGDPSEDVTALEMPAGLVLTPVPGTRFTAANAATTSGDVTEIWRARLGVLDGATVVEPPADLPGLRAIYNALAADPFAIPLDLPDRDLLVKAMSDYADTVQYPNHEVTEASRFWLSPAGAFLDLSGSWGGGTGTLQAWYQRALTGRDVVVRVTLRGRLTPFGHSASIVTVSERRFVDDSNGDPAAVLVQTDYLSVGQHVVSYPDANGFMPSDGRGVPFTSVRMLEASETPVGKKQVSFTNNNGLQTVDLTRGWIVTPADDTTTPLSFDFTATDRLGREVTFSAPVVFVPEERAFSLAPNTPLGKIRSFYGDDESLAFREIDMGGQSIAWADETEPGNARTAKVTDRLRLTLEKPIAGTTFTDLKDAGQPAFFPKVERAWVEDDAVDSIRGDATGPLEVVYAQDWLDHGTGASNAGVRYLDLVSPLTLTFPGDSRSLAQPDLKTESFSLALGAGVDPPPPNTDWNPAAALAGAAKFLGNFSLTDLIPAIKVSGNLEGDERLPHYEVVLEPTDNPTQVRYRFTWTPPLQSLQIGGTYAFVIADDLAKAGLPKLVEGPSDGSLLVEQVIPLTGDGTPTTEIDVTLHDFALEVPPIEPVLGLQFSSLRYHLPPDGGTDLDLDLAGFTFIGVLEFLETVEQFLKAVGGGAQVEVDSEQIHAHLDLPIPPITFGVLTVTNVKLGLDLVLPFTDEAPTTTLDIGTTANPFSLNLMGIPGLGHFRVSVAPEPVSPGRAGLKILELSLAFGLDASINVMIAGASVRVAIGASLTVHGDGTVVMTAFAELEGTLSIIGIEVLNAGVEASLSYNLSTKLLHGQLEVLVSTGLFGLEWSTWVEVDVSLGSDGKGALPAGAAPAAPAESLAFGDRFSKFQWTEYCDAFAAA